MPADFVIKPFLEAHRAEVKGMLLTEYDEVATMELFKEDGRVEGVLSTLADLVKEGILTEAAAAKRANLSVDEFEKKTALLPV